MTYITEDGKIYEVTVVKKEVDLKALKKELAEIKAMGKPSDGELIEIGRQYYEGIARQDEIEDLEKKIEQLEKLK